MIRHTEHGSLLIVLLLLIVVSAMIGMWGLSATQSGMIRAGHHKGSTSLVYQAEEGIQRAVRRIQEISENLNPQLTIENLVNPLLFPMESVANPQNPPCPEPFNPALDLNIVSNDEASNVICNFLGPVLENTQVMLVRKDDRVEGGIMRAAVFLINSIARDSKGRRQIVQAVAILPYEGDDTSGYTLPYGESAYLASVVKVAE